MVIFQKNEKIRDIKCQKMFFKSRVRELSSFLRWILTCDDLFSLSEKRVKPKKIVSGNLRKVVKMNHFSKLTPVFACGPNGPLSLVNTRFQPPC